jgi:hypothetical protein
MAVERMLADMGWGLRAGRLRARRRTERTSGWSARLTISALPPHPRQRTAQNPGCASCGAPLDVAEALCTIEPVLAVVAAISLMTAMRLVSDRGRHPGRQSQRRPQRHVRRQGAALIAASLVRVLETIRSTRVGLCIRTQLRDRRRRGRDAPLADRPRAVRGYGSSFGDQSTSFRLVPRPSPRRLLQPRFDVRPRTGRTRRSPRSCGALVSFQQYPIAAAGGFARQ